MISLFVIPIIAVVVSIEDLQCCMLGMIILFSVSQVHMLKLDLCISSCQYKIVLFLCLLGVISGKSGLPEPEPELSGTRNVGFLIFRTIFG